jgi:hypothetical protein
MKATNIIEAFKKANKRTHVVGDLNNGIIIALDMEGRLFTVLDGRILNRVNIDAIMGESKLNKYLNPGGDGLWPAPEGTTMGYQYSTGKWRVAPGLRGARYFIDYCLDNEATIIAEVDLINSKGIGIPTIFKRRIKMENDQHSINLNVIESITYIGRTSLSRSNCLIAPWTLCQFDCGPGCEVVFPYQEESNVWDLYEESSITERVFENGICRASTNGSKHYQIAMNENVPWIEFKNPKSGIRVQRKAGSLPKSQSYIDISDVGPDDIPSTKGVRYSVYSDPAFFMEIEAAGGCPDVILPNTEMKIEVNTNFTRS